MKPYSSLYAQYLTVGALIMLPIFFVACGDEKTIEEITQVVQDRAFVADEVSDLPDCTEDNEGEQAYVVEDSTMRICAAGKWRVTTNSASVVDTVYVDTDLSCTTEELADKKGLKILCNGDSIGVVYNGEKGEKGDEGEKGADGIVKKDSSACSVVSQSVSSLTIICGDKFTVVDLAVNFESADFISQDTAGWGHDFSEGTVRNGRQNPSNVYVYENGNWRLGTDLDSLLFKANGIGCIKDGDTSKVKYDSVYYVCTKQTGTVLRAWVEAPEFYNDTYEARAECNATGKYGAGNILKGRVNLDSVYVCENEEFRLATYEERLLERGCVSYSEGDTAYMFENEFAKYGKVCNKGKWDFFALKRNEEKFGKLLDERDGKTYYTITIGRQTLMAENLNYEYKVDSVVYNSYCGADSCRYYGRHYGWGAATDSAAIFSEIPNYCANWFGCVNNVTVRGICPEGWHLPTKLEWDTLLEDAPKLSLLLGSLSDSYGFSAIPADQCVDCGMNSGRAAVFWSSSLVGVTQVYSIWLGVSGVWFDYEKMMWMPKSIRCFQDKETE